MSTALVLPLLFFLHSFSPHHGGPLLMMLGFGEFKNPFSSPLEQAIAKFKTTNEVPEGPVAFIGFSEKEKGDIRFLDSAGYYFGLIIRGEIEVNGGRYAMVILDSQNDVLELPIKQLLKWARDLCQPGGYIAIYDPEEKKIFMSIQKKNSERRYAGSDWDWVGLPYQVCGEFDFYVGGKYTRKRIEFCRNHSQSEIDKVVKEKVEA